MTRKILTALAAAALCATGIHTAFALTSSGWKNTATLAGLFVDEDAITYAVTFPPYAPLRQSASSHNTTFTRHRAAIRCRNNAVPFNLVQVNGAWIYTNSIGGAANHSFSGACPANYTFQDGAAFIDESL